MIAADAPTLIVIRRADLFALARGAGSEFISPFSWLFGKIGGGDAPHLPRVIIASFNKAITAEKWQTFISLRVSASRSHRGRFGGARFNQVAGKRRFPPNQSLEPVSSSAIAESLVSHQIKPPPPLMAAGATLWGDRAEAEGRWRGTSGSLVIRPPFPRDGMVGLIYSDRLPHRHICCKASSHLGHLLATAALLSFTANRFLQRFVVLLRKRLSSVLGPWFRR